MNWQGAGIQQLSLVPRNGFLPIFVRQKRAGAETSGVQRSSSLPAWLPSCSAGATSQGWN
ncbi:hypothetical protein E2562_009032 [Oryza meyeriana var. granulata]|uniref:Uncharacterized protein n=1 Tax=Oryza meyeriana var. granulata TaxID=110450 RepID=A0A6G1CZG0_9ORYZ|nr:hypothetical protein E2562_009032 [Oryza meyeriana var. granulata]